MAGPPPVKKPWHACPHADAHQRSLKPRAADPTSSPETFEADPHASGQPRTVLREMAWQAHVIGGRPQPTIIKHCAATTRSPNSTGADRAVLYSLAFRKHELLPTSSMQGISRTPGSPRSLLLSHLTPLTVPQHWFLTGASGSLQ